MALEDVVLCSGGLAVARRGASLPPQVPGLRVGTIATIAPPTGLAVESRRTDNVVWRRHWLERDRLVIEFVGLAVVEVLLAPGEITFDRELEEDMEEHLLFDHVLPLVLAQRGALVVHGGLISRSGRGVLLMGSSGAGKSTLTAFAWQRGWTVGGDDAAVVRPTEPPTAEPTYTTVRLSSGSAALLQIDLETTSPVVGKVRVAPDSRSPFRREPVDLRVIADIERAPPAETPRFTELKGADAHARLFGSTFHAELSQRRLLPAIIDGLASIVEATLVGRLIVPRGLEGLAAAEVLLRAAVDGDGHAQLDRR